MQTTNLKFISNYNTLRRAAIENSQDFVDQFCDFICAEFQFNTAVLFKADENSKLVLLGKSSGSKKSMLVNSVFDCASCKLLRKEAENFDYSSDPKCEIRIGDATLNESCMLLKFGSARYLLKLVQRTPFTPAERDFFKIAGTFLISLLELWNPQPGTKGVPFSKFIADAANDFRTPTNSIVGFASLLSDDQLAPSQKEYVLTLRENAQKLLSLINDMIDYAKGESGGLPVIKSGSQLSSVVDEIFQHLSEKVPASVVTFQKTIDKNIPDSIKIDITKFKYVLFNFTSFLVNYIESGKIVIGLSISESGNLVIRIANSGNIKSAPNLLQICSGQTLLDIKNQRSVPISIFSLPLAKKYVDIMGGLVDYLSSPVKGSVITIQLPMEALTSIESKISGLPKIEGRNKVLVIEDDYATSKLLSNYLNKWGYEPHIINSGLKGLDLLKKEKFLAVIMDIVLPDINGLELLKKIHDEENCKYLPVIVCSVEAEQQKAFLMGAVEYFVKPIKYKDLVEVLTSYKLKKDSNILCVDDDVPTLQLVKSAIDSVGFNAIAESDSTKVMELIKNTTLDLAIIDLDMPEINGFELIKKIKSVHKFSNLPIIIYTGKENFDDDLRKIDGLFTELLSKRSTKIEDLADTINAMINRYEQPTTPEESKASPSDAPKVLLVEDYKHSQIIVTRLLKKNGFTSVVVVENGAEALDQVKQQRFDLILMDMQMPVMNGFEATERIRKLPEYKDTPIIALTAFAMKGDREKCLEAGATDYIPKPIDSQEFIEKVKYYTVSVAGN